MFPGEPPRVEKRQCLRMLWQVGCDSCGGCGYYETEDDPAERYCDCVAGEARMARDGDADALARFAPLSQDGWVGAIGVCQAFAVFGGPAARIAELTDDLRDARVYLQREREWTGSWDVSQADVRAIIEAVPESLKVAAHRLANAARLRHEERCGVVVTNLIEARAELARLRQELAALRGAK